MKRHGVMVAALIVFVLWQAFMGQAAASESLPTPEAIKGNGIIEGTHDRLLHSLRPLQKGCEGQFKSSPPANNVNVLLREYERRLNLLEQEAEKLEKDIGDKAKARYLTENSLRVQALVYLASYASEALFPLLRAGCVIDMKAK